MASCGCYVIFRARITTRDGQVLNAADYGKKAFPIVIRCSLHKR